MGDWTKPGNDAEGNLLPCKSLAKLPPGTRLIRSFNSLRIERRERARHSSCMRICHNGSGAEYRALTTIGKRSEAWSTL